MKDLLAVCVVIFIIGFIVCCGVAGVLFWKLIKFAFAKGRKSWNTTHS